MSAYKSKKLKLITKRTNSHLFWAIIPDPCSKSTPRCKGMLKWYTGISYCCQPTRCSGDSVGEVNFCCLLCPMFICVLSVSARRMTKVPAWQQSYMLQLNKVGESCESVLECLSSTLGSLGGRLGLAFMSIYWTANACRRRLFCWRPTGKAPVKTVRCSGIISNIAAV